jgi:hypothetical protein
MLKSIPKSNITRRSFKVYKRFTADEGDYTPLVASSSIDDVNNPLYRSIQKKYYTDNGLVQNYGTLRNPANFVNERIFPEQIYVINIPQIKIGEKIKSSSFKIKPNGFTEDLVDNGYGKITFPNPSYTLSSASLDDDTLTITFDGNSYELSLLDDGSDTPAVDIENGKLRVIDNGIPETYTIISIDFELGELVLMEPLDIEGTNLSEVSYGNIFYSDGIIILNATNGLDLSSYEMEYRATQTIHETEILIEAKAGEFNYSQNPSAVQVTLSGSYDFTTTAISNVSPAKTVKIKEVRDISQRQSFSGSYDTLITGSWDDYDEYRLTDPTGSYLAPYVTTIGIYDKDGDMVAIAKLPQPIKNLPDYDLNFIVRLDT